jgi:NAD(P)-dependent dehydrogenase (short-subunit alcohol dehydrogenase family)
LDSDVWMFVGADRDTRHVIELPVNDEDHEAIIQQEAFEPLGADRKVIIRGFVLGDEGNISMIWQNADVEAPDDYQEVVNETVLGRRLLDYLTNNAGPHILKSPFGDVWEVQFEGPKYKWLAGGHLQVDLRWIETGHVDTLGL